MEGGGKGLGKNLFFMTRGVGGFRKKVILYDKVYFRITQKVLFMNRPKVQSLSCNVRQSSVCVSVCAIAKNTLPGGLSTSGRRAY